MDTYLCPKGHASSEPDYCSECGAKMTGGLANSVPADLSSPVATPGSTTCPDCGTPRDQLDIAFCEICGYNFVTGAHGDLSAVPPPLLVEQGPVPVAVPSPTPTAAAWSATLTVDPSIKDPGSPEPPVDTGPFHFELATPVSLIGRKSQARAVFPEIPITYDDAVSHRHALLQLADTGELTVRDIGSSNGTRLNGAELTPMVDYPVHDGDQITLGHWSRLAIGNTLGTSASPQP